MPLKILYIIESTSGGAARHVIDLSKALIKKGHEIHVIYSTKRMDFNFENFINSTSNLHVYKLDMERSLNIFDIFYAYKIRKYIKTNGNFNIIHGHSSKGGALARLATIGTKIPTIYTAHSISTNNPELTKFKYIIFKFTELFLNKISRNGSIIAVSPDEYKHMKQIGLPEERLHIVLNCQNVSIKNNRQKIRKNIGILKNEVCIGCVARFCEQKAIDILLKAISLVFQKNRNVKLIIAGYGELEQELHNLADSLGINKQIIWLNNIAGLEIMNSFDIFVLPSNYEAMPYVLIEALNAGLPIIATNVGGASVTIEENKNGYIVPVGDYKKLADKLNILLNSPELRKIMGKISLKKASKFTINKMARETLAIYNELLFPKN